MVIGNDRLKTPNWYDWGVAYMLHSDHAVEMTHGCKVEVAARPTADCRLALSWLLHSKIKTGMAGWPVLTSRKQGRSAVAVAHARGFTCGLGLLPCARSRIAGQQGSRATGQQ